MMITTRLSSRSFQSMMNDETLGDDLTTLNQNSSSSILYRSLNIHYISQEYVFRSKKKTDFYLPRISFFFIDSEDNSDQSIKTESINQEKFMLENTKIEQDKSGLLKNPVNLTPRNIAVIELITSEQRFVHDMKNILKVKNTFVFLVPLFDISNISLNIPKSSFAKRTKELNF
jgi:hypothetical protein